MTVVNGCTAREPKREGESQKSTEEGVVKALFRKCGYQASGGRHSLATARIGCRRPRGVVNKAREISRSFLHDATSQLLGLQERLSTIRIDDLRGGSSHATF